MLTGKLAKALVVTITRHRRGRCRVFEADGESRYGRQMQLRSVIAVPGILLAVLAILTPRVASACSCDYGSRHVPLVGDATPEGAGFALWYFDEWRDSGVPPEVTAKRLSDGQPLDVVLAQHSDGLWIISFPDAAAGDQLAVISSAPVDEWISVDPQEHVFNLGIEPPLAEGGSVELVASEANAENLDLVTVGGSCNYERPIVYVDIAVGFSKTLAPFEDALMTEVLVAGNPAPIYTDSLCSMEPPSSSLLGRHCYRLWANCDGYPHDGLAVGTHDVEIRTWLPGTDLEWWSGPTTIELHCPPQADPAPDVESGGDHTGPSDGDEPGEMGEMGDGDEQSAVGDDESGCSTGAGRVPHWMVVLVALVSVRRLF